MTGPARHHAAGISYLRTTAPATGSPLVLLHGIGSDAESWTPLLRALDPAIDALAWDAPGYGESQNLPEAAPTPAQYADRLALWLDALGLERVVLVGHSLGTLFAARFAVAHPRRVAALALLSPALGYGVAAGAPLPAVVQARIDDLQRLGAAAFAAQRAQRLVHRGEQKPDVLAGVRRGMAAVLLPGYAQAVHALGSGALLADAAELAAPTLVAPIVVAVGAEDIVTPPANARAVHAVLRRPLALELIPDCGHALPQEAPSRVADLLGALMREAEDV